MRYRTMQIQLLLHFKPDFNSPAYRYVRSLRLIWSFSSGDPISGKSQKIHIGKVRLQTQLIVSSWLMSFHKCLDSFPNLFLKRGFRNLLGYYEEPYSYFVIYEGGWLNQFRNPKLFARTLHRHFIATSPLHSTLNNFSHSESYYITLEDTISI